MSDGVCVERPHWAYTGTGYRTLGDAWLAESARATARERRRVARQELRGSPRSRQPFQNFKPDPGGSP